MSADSIASEIVAAAIEIGGSTWDQIKKSAPIYIKGFSQALFDIAAGVAKGEISKTDGKIYASTARLMLVQGIANSAHILLVQVQAFMQKVFNIVKANINAALPIALL